MAGSKINASGSVSARAWRWWKAWASFADASKDTGTVHSTRGGFHKFNNMAQPCEFCPFQAVPRVKVCRTQGGT